MHQIRYIEGRDYVAAAEELGVGVDVIRAVAAVEARSSGFIKGTDLPVILFEGHHFHRFTGGRYGADHPSISYASWTKSYYKGGRGEYDRLLEAIHVHSDNPEPALLSTSWGMFQIMGFNYGHAGYDSVVDFVNAMATEEGAHLRAFASFVRSSGLVAKLRDRRWAEFAEGYNGKEFRRNAYDKKLAAAFARERARLEEELGGGAVAPERGEAVALQVALNAALADQLAVKLTTDGWIGDKTEAAIRLYQRLHDMPQTGELTAALAAELGVELAILQQKAA